MKTFNHHFKHIMNFWHATWIQKLQLSTLWFTSYPFSEALLTFWPANVHSFPSRNKLHQYYPEGVYICLFCDLSTLCVLWSQVPTHTMTLMFLTYSEFYDKNFLFCFCCFFPQVSSGFTQMFQALLFPPPFLRLAATLLVQNLQPDQVHKYGCQKDKWN